MSPRPITITSYNMHKGMSALNRKVQVDSMAEELRGIGSDVLFLQEVQGQHLMRSNRLPDFPEKPHYDILGDRLSYNRSYGKNAVYPQRHHGNAILSPGFVDLDSLGDIDHGLIHCEAPAAIQSHLLWSPATISTSASTNSNSAAYSIAKSCPKAGKPRSSASAPTSTCANPTAPNNTAPSSNTSCITSTRKAR